MIKDWLQIVQVDTSTWPLRRSIKDWWLGLIDSSTPNRKAMASLTVLTAWTIWNERNAHVFCNKATPPPVILDNIKRETSFWVVAAIRN